MSINTQVQKLLDSKRISPFLKKNQELSSTGDTKQKLSPILKVLKGAGNAQPAFGRNNSQSNFSPLRFNKNSCTRVQQIKTLNSDRDPIELTISLYYQQQKFILTIGLHETTTDLFKKLYQKLYAFDKNIYDKIRHFQTLESQKDILIDYYLSLENEPLSVFQEYHHLKLEPFYIDVQKSNNNQNYEEQMKIDDYQILKCIGVGGFSRVYLVRKKDTGQYYAMKVIDKYFILKTNKEVIINNEREVMGNMESPFLAKLYYAFETKYYLAFVVEYCAGGELFYHLRKLKRLDEDLARQYFAQVCLAIQYLHSQGVVYRDIKPENILLDLEGYVHLSDFGLAKPNMGREDTAYSFCGSPEYMSPEMLLREGHNFMVDIYCLGALLYEFVCGIPPFYSRNIDSIYQSILTDRAQLPSNLQISPDLRDLICKLLIKNPAKRLGCKEGINEIFQHSWFKNFDFKALHQRKLKIKYKPYPLKYNFDELEFSKGDAEFQQKLYDNLHREQFSKFDKYFLGFDYKIKNQKDERAKLIQDIIKNNLLNKERLNSKRINLMINTFSLCQEGIGLKITQKIKSVRGSSNVQAMQALSFRSPTTKRFNTDVDLGKFINS